jgi:hypothetical protein
MLSLRSTNPGRLIFPNLREEFTSSSWPRFVGRHAHGVVVSNHGGQIARTGGVPWMIAKRGWSSHSPQESPAITVTLKK